MNNDKYYPILLEYVGPNQIAPHLQRRIRILQSPGLTNLGREPKIDGWLGTTDDWSQHALGEHDANSVRELLIEHGVQIPNDVPIRYVDYSIGAETSEQYNQEFAYTSAYDIITLVEAAELYPLAYSTLAQAAREGRLGGRRAGERTFLTTRADIEAAIADGQLRPREKSAI